MTGKPLDERFALEKALEEYLRLSEDVERASQGIVNAVADAVENHSATAIEALSAIRRAVEEQRRQQDLSA